MGARESIYLEGFAHRNPVPVASRVGSFVHSGVLTGRDPKSLEMPDTLEEQMTNVFERIRELMDAVGGSVDDIAKLTFWLADYRDRDALNREWEAMFPSPADRPARQAMAATLDGGSKVQCDVVAILTDERI
ncbi:RidA family protein [Salinibacterium sp. ZJ70]|uniref:RidA family protein n=1 Tax=Salinibacterium sp. ZJ70 TaxID=2708084 RepID=UPI0014231943|nr:RidA family protein [Salinibacterium sp. ZJ70]